MKRRLLHSKASGQSIPLIAAMIVVLLGMAGLAFDVGNTYAQQREVVRGTNAASIEGMNAVLASSTPAEIQTRVMNSLLSNHLPVVWGNTSEPGKIGIKVDLIDASGNAILTCPIPACSTDTYNTIRPSVSYVRVQTIGTVETSFARIVGYNQLPVNAAAHASRGLCPSGVYPLAVDGSLLDLSTQRFDQPDAIYRDETYRNKTQKRLFLRDVNGSGDWGFLRWRADQNTGGSAATLSAALTGDGTVSDGYREAAWPTGVNLQQTPGYPSVPDHISVGDWLAGADPSLFNGVSSQLDAVIRNRTRLTLPIFQEAKGGDSNGAYYLADVGNFYIRAYGNVTQANSAQYGGRWGNYIDLVYLGSGAQCAGLVTGPAIVSTMTLEGQVSFFPHYASLADPTDLPIQYIVVLDVSGSMSWSFSGQANQGGSLVTCQGAGSIECSAGTILSDVSQRRIKVAHDLLLQFVDGVRAQDQVRMVTFSSAFGSVQNPPLPLPDNSEALDTLSNVYPGVWTSDKTVLRDAVNQAASGLNNNYVTSGETPSAVGLARALDLYENSPSVDPISGKQYKRAVIFLTDGVANVTRNGLLNRPANCGSEDISCQEGQFPAPNNWLKPISAMYAEAQSLTNLIAPSGSTANGAGIYVIALGTETVASALQRISPNLYYANQPGALQTALNAIRNQVTFSSCNDGGASRISPLQQIGSNGLPDAGVLASRGVSLPTIGIVTLNSAATGNITGPITWDSASGRLYYRITDIPPGQYTMSYWLAYAAPEETEPQTRIYTHALPLGGGSLTTDSQLISMIPSASNIGSTIQPIVMDMNPTINVCTATP